MSATQKILRKAVEEALQQEKELKKAESLVPRSVWARLRKAFTPKGLPFFEFYILLKKIEMGEPVPTNIKRQFLKAANRLLQITSPVDSSGVSAAITNQVAEMRPEMNMLLGRLLLGRVDDTPTWRKINELFVPLFLAVARDKEVFLKARPLGPRKWAILRRMTPKQEGVEKLRDNDPEAFALVQEYRSTLEEIDKGVRKRILEEGLQVEQGFLMGRPVLYGINPNTSERMVFDHDGEVLSRDEYFAKRRVQDEARKTLSRVPTRTEVPLADLRRVPDDVVGNLSGAIEWVSLTDDKAKQGRLTRIFPVKNKTTVHFDEYRGVEETEGHPVIVAGRFKGIYLDDMINSQGRLIEGTAYSYSPSTGHGMKVPVRIDPGDREPYVSAADVVTEGRFKGRKVKQKKRKLFLKIPGATEYTELRHAVKKIACNTGAKRGCIPSVTFEHVEGSRAAAFYFEPKDFGIIMETLQGMSLSSSALGMIKSYYKDLSNAEDATAEKNLSNYSAANIGGFVTRKKSRETGELVPFDLNVTQKQAMAWLDANGNKGVCAPETGVGKCVTGSTLIVTNQGVVPISHMQPGEMTPGTETPLENWQVLVGGNAYPVKSFYYGGERRTIKVTTRRGYEVEGSLTHPLLVRTPDGQESWIKTPELEHGDYLCVDRKEGVFPIREPLLEVPQPEDFLQGTRNSDKQVQANVTLYKVPSQMNPDLGRLLGYLVAEGWLNARTQFSISQWPDKNPEVRADIEALLLSQLGWKTPQDAGNEISISSLFLRDYLFRMGLGYGVAKDKEVPLSVLQARKESLRQFLRGLLDAESHVQGKGRTCIDFTSASETLAKQVQILLLRFGIICTRVPKKVLGYEHIYWRLTITGQDAILYRDRIGFVSSRKQAALEDATLTRNANLDVVPHMAMPVGALFDAILSKMGLNHAGLRRKSGGASLDTTVGHIRKGRRNPTYTFLQQLSDLGDEAGCQMHTAYLHIQGVLHRGLYYDPIKSLCEGHAEVMDISVDAPQHCFVGNGLVNHNTLIAVAGMQKLIRDGMADEDASYTRPDGKEVKTNGRFLYVCPTALKGNLPKEIRAFVSDARDLLKRVDEISYNEFATASKSRKRPTSLGGVKFWKGKKWDPSLYVAIFFDEAHKMRNTTSGASKSALKLWHPRKVCLTASPMDKRPMDAYVLAAISNNTQLVGKTPEAKDNRREMRRFKERFCESVGGRIVGVKADPLVRRDLHTWIRRNIFYADKRNTGDGLPELRAESMVAVMPPQVEDAYRAVTDQFAYMMKGLVTRFRDREKSGIEGRDPTTERIMGKAFRPIVKLLNDLSNNPEVALLDIAHMLRTETLPIPDKEGNPVPLPRQFKRALKTWRARFTPEELEQEAAHLQSPKLLVAESVIKEKVDVTDGSSRTILFTDDKKLCWSSAQHMAKSITGWHAVALRDQIAIVDGSGLVGEIQFEMPQDLLGKLTDVERERVLTETGGVSTHTLPFRKKAYRKYPELPPGPDNIHYRADNWQQFALKEIISQEKRVRTMTLHGPTYQYGHNLQAFDTVIHLDRDSWNSESMKQRTARAWRQGQGQPVDEVTVDAVYNPSEDHSELDATLDEIRKYFQQMDSDVFDAIMREAQGLELGSEWGALSQHDSSKAHVDKDILELMASPYMGRVKGI